MSTFKNFILHNKFFPIHRFRKCSYLLSYRKCGRTWVSTVFMHYVAKQRDQIDEALEFALNPDHTFPTYFKYGRKVIFLHNFYHNNINPEEASNNNTSSPFYHKPTVFLVRDPRDVIVSYFHHARARADKNQLKSTKSLDQFTHDPKFGIKPLIKFYNLQANYVRQAGHSIFVKYEDLGKQNPLYLDEWRKIFSYLLQKNIDLGTLVWALEVNDFKKMQQREMNSKNKLVKTKNNTGENTRVRSGKIGGYKDEFETETLDFINKYIKENLDNDLDFYKK